MANKSAGASAINSRSGGPMSVMDWFSQPGPQYIPLADVGFGPLQPVMPQALPPSSMVFSNPTWNQMLNLPSAMTIVSNRRTGAAF